MRINAVIVEDEVHNRNNLVQLVQKYCPDIIVAAACGSADEAIIAIKENKPQLVFLDIQMPGKDGFQLLSELDHVDFEIIFVTAFSTYGIQAIKFSAIDYLLKPVDIDELKSAVDKAVRKIKQQEENKNLQNLLYYLRHNNKADHRIAITSLTEIRLVPVSDIVRCESENTYTFFYLNSGEKILSTVPIINYDDMLSGYGFLRCHQSHLVNRKYVKSFLKKDGYALLLQDNTNVPVSRLKRDAIKADLIDL